MIADINKIFAHHNLPQPKSITSLAGGIVNAVYDVDDAYIIRFNLRDPHVNKFEREVIAYRFLQGRVAVPELVAYSRSGGVVVQEYIVLRFYQLLYETELLSTAWQYWSEARYLPSVMPQYQTPIAHLPFAIQFFQGETTDVDFGDDGVFGDGVG